VSRPALPLQDVVTGFDPRSRLSLLDQAHKCARHVATFHRPHPEKEAKPYQVRDARAFFEQAGVNHEPDDL
jgi:hypothetical protein